MQQPIIKAIMMPKDTNIWGTVFGGVILNHIDEAAGVEAIKHTDKARMVTVAMKEVVFKAPVLVGDLVSFYCRDVKIGHTSVTVNIEVIAERRNHESIKVTEASVVFVAIDDQGKPCNVVG